LGLLFSFFENQKIISTISTMATPTTRRENESRQERQQQEKEQHHHFFLMRHCIRSLEDTGSIDMTMPEGVNDDAVSTSVSDYFAAPLPDWKVPSKWCTELGADLAETMGTLFWENYVIGQDRQGLDGIKVKVEIIADESQRDIDTAYNFAMGIEDMEETDPPTNDGVHVLSYAPWLFSPDYLCTTEYFDDEAKQKMEKRFAKVQKPEEDAVTTLHRLRDIMGESNLSVDSIPGTWDIQLDKTKTDLTGALNLLSHMGEMFFWSRASHIPFAPLATSTDVYKFLQWENYKRSVLNVGSPRSAYHGALLGNAMINVLKDGYYAQHSQNITTGVADEEEEEYDDRVTVLVGHDTDLDAMATVLGIAWDLQAPYLPSPDGASLLPTPPYSGIHVKRNVQTGHISLSYLYPVFSNAKTGEWWSQKRNLHMDSAPLQFEEKPVVSNLVLQDHPAMRSTSSRIDNTTTRLEFPDALDRLEERLQSMLGGYTGAQTCYQKAEDYRNVLLQNSRGYAGVRSQQVQQSQADVAGAMIVGFTMGVSLVAVLVCGIIGYRAYRLRGQLRKEQNEHSFEIGNLSDDDMDDDVEEDFAAHCSRQQPETPKTVEIS